MTHRTAKGACILAISTILTLPLGVYDCWAKVIQVPGDVTTIQAGINAAANGDTVEVSPGTYIENINFNGKLITVTSRGGPTVTIIDGSAKDSVVSFKSSESALTELAGFTLKNGSAGSDNFLQGGGIFYQLFFAHNFGKCG